MLHILAIDPGPKESSYVVLDEAYTLQACEEIENEYVVGYIQIHVTDIDLILIEKIIPYYRVFGHTLIDTIRFEGRLWQKCLDLLLPCHLVSRKEYGRAIIGKGKIDDATLYDALKLRGEFAKQLLVLNSNHRRSAFALAVYYLDKKKTGGG